MKDVLLEIPNKFLNLDSSKERTMPALVRSANTSEVYKLYSKAEIKKSWVMLTRSHRLGIEDGGPYVMCKVNNEDEALVLAALIMRKIEMPPASTHFNEDTKLLFINGNYLDVGYDRIKEDCSYIFNIYLGMKNLDKLRSDLGGEPLFWHPGTHVDEFYKARNFPRAEGSEAPMFPDSIRSSNIHEHINAKYMGMI